MTRASVLESYAEAKYGEGTDEARIIALDAWQEAAEQYLIAGDDIKAGHAFVSAARASREIGKPLQGGRLLERALTIGLLDETLGAGWGTAGSEYERQRIEQRRQVLDEAGKELAVVEDGLALDGQIQARITSNPAGGEVRYRRYVATNRPLASITTNTTKSLEPAMYLFEYTAPDGKLHRKAVECWVNCAVHF